MSTERNNIAGMIEVLSGMKSNGAFKKYIEYIVFPYYKNLVPNTRINFDFPITILVGKNGSGKSSTLHALYGAPYNKSCSDFWFNTEVDPIEETKGKGRNRFFYGYKENHHDEIKEVVKSRIKRGSDPDYWETSRPLKSDGMINAKTRNSPLKKNVVYLDFRAEVSAFDKIYHFSEGDLAKRKELLRRRSKYLNRLFHGERMRFPGKPDDKIGRVMELDEHIKKCISNILGKEYVSIKIADHRIYRNPGTSIYVKTKVSSNYSEANAGSGEVAIIQLVKKIEEADDYSLILLDEPEVSIHPLAQEKLKEYLLEVTKRKKLQVIISTHSKVLVEHMPSEAVKLYITNKEGMFEIKEDVDYREAFYDLEEHVSANDKKKIWCEDYAAKRLIEKVLESIDKSQYFDIAYPPGGSETIITKHVPTIVTHNSYKDDTFIVLDGDKETDHSYNLSDFTTAQCNDKMYLKECVKNAYGTDIPVYTDGGRGGQRVDQAIDLYKKYLEFSNTHVFYLPNKHTPEGILLKSKYALEEYKDIYVSADITDGEVAKEKMQRISEKEYGDTDHINSIIDKLAYKFSNEESDNKDCIIRIIDEIFRCD